MIHSKATTISQALETRVSGKPMIFNHVPSSAPGCILRRVSARRVYQGQEIDCVFGYSMVAPPAGAGEVHTFWRDGAERTAAFIPQDGHGQLVTFRPVTHWLVSIESTDLATLGRRGASHTTEIRVATVGTSSEPDETLILNLTDDEIKAAIEADLATWI